MSEFQRTYEDTLGMIGRGADQNGVRQFISFRVGTEDYAIDILAVREIKGWTRTTVLPNQPDYVRGVLNLRGAIVPVFDLRSRFGQGPTEATAKHVVVIVAVGDRLVGLLVDQVSDILSVADDNIGAVPETSIRGDHRYLAGIITQGDTMVVLLALDTLFDTLTLPGDQPAHETAA
ncbi:chemotaxis protein CheW [Asticcacaulis sp. AC402]|uniref:chemotaxis protein CheW n=1 Tax=Asticcacaulis sp. AC402 TaxID=1282361 RepID=UPI0003C3C1A8|nr:chemotaxis protein CheW [Asticcacaulis sp. AC402]ESQ77652.1 chemotaxis protein CheW [Asticcacaulis sp. AC402]